MLASNLGAAYAFSQAPNTKQKVEDRRTLQRLEKYSTYKSDLFKQAKQAQEEAREELKGQVSEKFLKEGDLEVAKLQVEEADAFKAYIEEATRQGKSPLPNDGGAVLGSRLGKLAAEQKVEKLQRETVESKRGVKNAVKDRLALLKNQQTNIGAFKDLPEKLQKQIAEELEKGDKK